MADELTNVANSAKTWAMFDADVTTTQRYQRRQNTETPKRVARFAMQLIFKTVRASL
jgi:hypothetical protein